MFSHLVYDDSVMSFENCTWLTVHTVYVLVFFSLFMSFDYAFYILMPNGRFFFFFFFLSDWEVD